MVYICCQLEKSDAFELILRERLSQFQEISSLRFPCPLADQQEGEDS